MDQKPGVKPPSDMECAMQTILKTFNKYAGGNKNYLTRQDFEKLMTTEFAGFMKNQPPGTLDKMLHEVDNNNDNRVEFMEFFPLIAGMTDACYQLFCRIKP